MKLFGNNLTFNGNKIYHEANKPVASDIAFEDGKTLDTEVNEIKSSIVNNASQITFNSTQGLEATNVSEALDELHELASQPVEAELKFEIVEELPQTGQPGTIYMKKLPLEEAGVNNKYEAYIWVNNSWETLGDGLKRTEVYSKSQTFSKEEIIQLLSANNIQKLIIRLSAYDDRSLIGTEVKLTNLTTSEVQTKTYNGVDELYFLVPFMERYKIEFQEQEGTVIYPVEDTASVGIRYIRGYYAQYMRYGIRINKKESDPSARVEYIEGAMYKQPITVVDKETREIDYGDWGDAWFIRDNKPCMLQPNGDVAYYLNKTDQYYDADGNYVYGDISDVNNSNTMMSEIPLGYLYEYEDDDYTYHIVSNVKIDENYKALAFTDTNGDIKDKVYIGCQAGINSNGKLKSHANIKMSNSTIKNTQQDHDLCTANGNGWHMMSYSMYHYLKILTTMVFKTTDFTSQLGFGYYTTTSGTGVSSLYHGKEDYMCQGQFVPLNKKTTSIGSPRLFYIEGLYGPGNVVGGLVVKRDEDGTTPQLMYKPNPPFDYTGTGEGWKKINIPLNATGFINQITIDLNIGSIASAMNGTSSTYFANAYFASPDSTNGQVAVGGYLLKDYYNLWGVDCISGSRGNRRIMRLMYI